MSSKYFLFTPDKILIEQRVLNLPFTKEILNKLPLASREVITTINDYLSLQVDCNYKESTLVLAKQEGQFFKHCPCTQNHVCCNYYFLNIGTNCNIGCSYCILQGYLNNPFLTVYTNLEDMFLELDDIFNSTDKFIRVGTGELTDSLLLDDLTDLSQKLIPYFLKHKNAVLELKTKTVNIDNLFKFNPEKKVMVSWSLNPQIIIDKEEPYAASLIQRLEAARRCARKGYLLGFHFDPLIFYPEWESGYLKTIDLLFEFIEPEQIAWISLGTLRYPKMMDAIIRKNHPLSSIVLSELFPGLDGKMRYFKPLREQMLTTVRDRIIKIAPSVEVYFCMESIEVWKNVCGNQVFKENSLSKKLDNSVQKR